jgi:hypothetical protein
MFLAQKINLVDKSTEKYVRMGCQNINEWEMAIKI